MQTTYHHPFSIMLRNIWSLILREMRTRFGSQTLGFLWAVLEPIGMIAVLALIFSTGLKAVSYTHLTLPTSDLV